ncbi:MAG: DUF1080 domain-containing protein [Gemmataceae bacterium]|nr:DUF1080 domain-containing protein [Gemmataceae bacterium]
MRRLVPALLLLLAVFPAEGREDKPAPAKEDAFLTDDLSGWEGMIKEFWTYKDGVLVGNSGEKGIKFNTFLCSKRKYKDFELSFKVKLRDGSGNSGVQVRSKVDDKKVFAVAGPQCDIGAGYWGSVYGERFGDKLLLTASKESQKSVKAKDFNDYRIVVKGDTIKVTINGTEMVDGKIEKMPEDGIIAFQLHGGDPMEVTFKDIVFKELK